MLSLISRRKLFMKKSLKITFVGLWCFFLPTVALAENMKRLPDPNIRFIRPAAMGEAFTAVADDQNALYYNPAGLARLKGWSLEIVSPILGFNGRTRAANTDIKDLATAAKDFNNSESARDTLKSILSKLGGEDYFGRFGINPYFVRKSFGLGILLNTEVTLRPHGFGADLMDLYLPADTEVRMGYALSFWDEAFSVGASVYGRGRLLIEESMGTDRIATFTGSNAKNALNDWVKTGAGVGVDVGILYTPIKMWEPTLGVSMSNIGDTKFYKIKSTSKFSGSQPRPLPQSLSMGVSLTPTWGSWFARASTDFRHMNLPMPASDKFRLGLEGGWKGRYVSAALQTGSMEGYLTAGFEVRLLLINLRYATFATSRGNYPAGRPDRQHIVNAKILL